MHHEAQINYHVKAKVNFPLSLLAEFQIVDNWINDIVLRDAKKMQVVIDTKELCEVSVLDVVIAVECYNAGKSGEQIEEEGSLQIFLRNFSTSIHSVYISCEGSTEADDNIDEPDDIDRNFVVLSCIKHILNVCASCVWNNYAFQ